MGTDTGTGTLGGSLVRIFGEEATRRREKKEGEEKGGKEQGGKEEGGNRGGKADSGSLWMFIRSCEVRAGVCLPGAKGTVEHRGGRNGASSSQNELGRGQSDKQRRVAVKEADPEGLAGEQHRSTAQGLGSGRGRGSSCQAGSLQPRLLCREMCQGLQEPKQLQTGLVPVQSLMSWRSAGGAAQLP